MHLRVHSPSCPAPSAPFSPADLEQNCLFFPFSNIFCTFQQRKIEAGMFSHVPNVSAAPFFGAQSTPMMWEPWQVWVPTGSAPHWQHPKEIWGVPWGTTHSGNISSSSSLCRSPQISGTAAPTATLAPPCPPPWSRASLLWLWRQSKCQLANSLRGHVSKFSS